MEREQRAQRHMKRAMQLMDDQSFGARSRIQDESFGVNGLKQWLDDKKGVPREHKKDLEEKIKALETKIQELERKNEDKTTELNEQIKRVREEKKTVQACRVTMMKLQTDVNTLQKELENEKKDPLYKSQFDSITEIAKKRSLEVDILKKQNAMYMERVATEAETEELAKKSEEIRKTIEDAEKRRIENINKPDHISER